MVHCLSSGCEHRATDDEDFCERHQEHQRDLFREEHMVSCSMCGDMMLIGAFDRHQWRHYYRDGERPHGNRVPNWW